MRLSVCAISWSETIFRNVDFPSFGREALAQRVVEDSVSSRVREICNNDEILVRDTRPAMEIEIAADRNQDRDH